jgi:hypothetical protein
MFHGEIVGHAKDREIPGGGEIPRANGKSFLK